MHTPDPNSQALETLFFKVRLLIENEVSIGNIEITTEIRNFDWDNTYLSWDYCKNNN